MKRNKQMKVTIVISLSLIDGIVWDFLNVLNSEHKLCFGQNILKSAK